VAFARFRIVSSIALLSAVAIMSGCASQNRENEGGSYPSPAPPSASTPSASAQQSSYTSSPESNALTTPQSPSQVPPAEEGKRVPAGARLVSSGAFPPPSFDASEGGTLYIFDDDTNSVALVTSIGSSSNRNVNIADMPNVANSLNNKHHFRVYFVPLSGATTLPSPMGH
jgi:hypothetical protein